jgi:UMP-CMP kinase
MTEFYIFFTFGAPGAGKTTLLKMVEERLGVKHLAAGDLIREEACKKDSNFAVQINKCLESGKLIPSEITFSIIEKAINSELTKTDSIINPKFKKKIFIIDGYPRNKENLDMWNQNMCSKWIIQGGVVFKCNDSICFSRCLSRKNYRSDDKIWLIYKRIKSFKEETLPIVEQLASNIKIYNVNSEKSEEEVYLELKDRLYNMGLGDLIEQNT